MTNKETYIQLFKLLGFSFVIFEKAETILEDNFIEHYLSETKDRYPHLMRIPVLPEDVNLKIIKESFAINTTIVNIQRLSIYEYQIVSILVRNFVPEKSHKSIMLR